MAKKNITGKIADRVAGLADGNVWES